MEAKKVRGSNSFRPFSTGHADNKEPSDRSRVTRFLPSPPVKSRIPSRDGRGNLRIEVRGPGTKTQLELLYPATTENDVYAEVMIGLSVACL